MKRMISFLNLGLLNMSLRTYRPTRAVIVILSMFMSFVVGIGDVVSAQEPVLSVKDQPTIQVIVEASTWKTRGRLLYDIEGSILKQLSLAGFQVVHDTTKPHQYQLVVQYEEERGAQYGVALWGTTIHATFFLRGAGMDKSKSWKIHETSTNMVSGPAPYLDALLKFETHPHYFFLGAMLEYMTKGVSSQPDALRQAVTEFVTLVYPMIDETIPQDGVRIQDHYMDNSGRVYQEVALRRALDELVDQEITHDQLVPIAERLLKSTDPLSRIRAIQVLGKMQNAAIRKKIYNLAKDDPHHVVRHAAKQLLSL